MFPRSRERRTPRIHPERVLLPLGISTGLSLMGDSTMYTVLPTHAAEAGVALSAVGILLGINRAVRVLSNGPAGLLYDRWPRRRLFVPALFFGALSTAIYAATRGFWPLLCGRLLWGLAWSGIWVGGATIILDVTTAKDRGRWAGLYEIWFFLGAALGTFGGGLLTDQIGYSTAMWIGASLTGLGGLAALLFLPETRGLCREHPPQQKRLAARLYRNGGLWVVASLHAANRFVIAGVLVATTGLLIQDWPDVHELGLGVATMTGGLLAGRTVLGMLAAPLSGRISDRLGSRWKAALGGLAVGVVSLVLIAWPTPGIILAGIALSAVSSGGLQGLITALTGDLVSQEQRGGAIGLVHTTGDLGSALGPPIAYALLPWVTLTGVYLLCAGVFAMQLAVVAWFQWKVTRPRAHPV